ncbi:hypothetical protein ACOMHN_040054 [Nucella lapillus]
MNFQLVKDQEHREDQISSFIAIRNLGLCVKLDEDKGLYTFLEALSCVQIVLCLLGFLGSAVAVAVWVKQLGRLKSCSVQLACLSVYDVVFLLASLCLCVALPCWAGARFTVGLALKRTVLVLVLGLAFTLPFLLDLIFSFSRDGCHHTYYTQNSILPPLDPGDGLELVYENTFNQRYLTQFGLVYTLYISLLFLLPFITILVTFVILLYHLRRSRSRRRPSSGVQPKEETSDDEGERQLSVLVAGLSGWHVVSMLLPTLLFLLRLTRVEPFQPQADFRVTAVADTIVILSCCSSFVFFFLLSPPFRQEVSGCLRAGWGRVKGRAAGRHRMRLTTDGSSNDTEPVVVHSFSSKVHD